MINEKCKMKSENSVLIAVEVWKIFHKNEERKNLCEPCDSFAFLAVKKIKNEKN